MKNYLFLALLLLPAMYGAGQIQNVDSLVHVLETQKLTTEQKIRLYTEICDLSWHYNYDKCIEYSNAGLALAEKTNDKKGIMFFYNSLGVAYFSKESFDSSYVFLNKSLDVALKSKDRKAEAVVYGNFATMYRLKNDYQTAVEYYLKSLKIKDDRDEGYAKDLVNLATLHSILKHWDHAVEYLEEAMEIAESLNSDYIKMGACHTLGTIYGNRQDREKAIEYYKKSLELSKKFNNTQYEIINNQSIATAYSVLKRINEAFEYGNEAVRLAEEFGVDLYIVSTNLMMSTLYLKSNQYKKSEEMALKVWAVDSTSLSEGVYAAYNLAIANIHLGNKEKAEYYVLHYQEIVFMENEKQMRESITEMEVKYETEKKEMRIASLEKERRLYLWLIISAGLLLVALVIMLLLTIKNARKQRRLVAAEALQEGEIGERARIAKDLHDRLGGSLTAVKIGLKNAESLQNIDAKIDTCMKELRDITNNIMPRSLQKFGMKGALEDFGAEFPNLRFHFFGEDKRISLNQEYVVYCCARELVNNALKHSGATSINMQLIQSRKHVSLTVQDNGCGFDEKTVVKGDGLLNIRNRVDTCKGKTDIYTAPGKGTETVIELRVES